MMSSNRAFQMSKLSVLTAAAFAVAALAHAADAKASSPTPQRPLGDPEIVQYVLDAESYEQQASEVAKNKASTPAVRQLADHLGADHSALDEEFRSLGLPAKDSDLGEELTARSQERLGWLNKLRGDRFEEAYVDYEVSFHNSVLATLDQVLLRNATDSALRARLQELRSKMAAQLADAARVQDSTERRMIRESP
jgi:putative membrane protein